MPKGEATGSLRVAAAQVNPVVGDIEGNSKQILESTINAKDLGVEVLLFPEMVVTGYPVEDLALRPAFRAASLRSTEELARSLKKSGCGEILVGVGFLDDDGRPLNSLALIHDGQIKARYVKRHLPNYGVFDEFRNFAPGNESLLVRFKGVDIAVAICEDIWRDEGPMHDLTVRRPGLVLVPNGSPYERSKDDIRLDLVSKRATQIGAPIVYTNMFGGQDDLVFDGDSMVVSAKGELLGRSPQFQSDLLVVDLPVALETGSSDLIISSDAPSSKPEVKLEPKKIEPKKIEPKKIAPSLSDSEAIWSALVLGLRDYVAKNQFQSVILGLSGGIDSAVVATLAVDALGASRVFALSLPSKYSSDHSKSDAWKLAENLAINLRTIEIEPIVQSFLNATTLKGLAEENVQARVRGSLLMGLSNQEGHLVLATGNKSELAVGYSTLYGDAVGGYAPIKDVFKVDIWRLAKWRNAKAIASGQLAPIPESSIAKEPSAELRPGQRDSDSIPEYSLLDPILELYIDKGGDASAIVAAGFEKSLVDRIILLVDRAEYKRRQYPPGPKVTPIAFGKDRRLPMTSRWREGN